MNKYQSLVAWQRAHEIAKRVLSLTDGAYHLRKRDLFSQIRRAAISVEANIVEGYALGTTALFRRHLRVALGSAAEVECLVRLAAESGYLRRSVAEELETLLGAYMAAIQGLRRSPVRFKI